jgi:hypothetical protein
VKIINKIREKRQYDSLVRLGVRSKPHGIS